MKWRAMTAADLTAIQRLADTQHVCLPERPEVFAKKFELFRDGCLVMVQEGAVVGYCFSHPWFSETSHRSTPCCVIFRRPRNVCLSTTW
jgi:hypothetical protein